MVLTDVHQPPLMHPTPLPCTLTPTFMSSLQLMHVSGYVTQIVRNPFVKPPVETQCQRQGTH